MNNSVSLAFALYCSLTLSNQGHGNDLESPYLGQTPPGSTPEVFAPGIISVDGRYEFGISFSPDLNEVYFSAKEADQPTAIHYSKMEDGLWTSPRRADFTKGAKDTEMKPFVSLNEDRIYFTAYDEESRNTKIWYATRSDGFWNAPQELDSPINGDRVFYLNQGKGGDLYFTNIAQKKMYYAPNRDGAFPEVKELEIEFGIQGYISPSQDYLVVDWKSNEGEGRKDRDIYVCFKEADGTWSSPINLGSAINSTFTEAVPSITPDGKYLFFSRYNEEGGFSNFYWVSAQVIENLRNEQ